MRRHFAILALLAGTVLSSSCGVFGGDEDETEPMELVSIDTKIKVKRLWSAKVGGASEFLRVALRPVGDGNNIFAASQDGNVVALNPETGKQLWRNQLDIELSVGPAVGEGMVVVGAKDGYIIGLDAATGSERWRTDAGAESLARPALKGDMVVVLTIDSRLQGFAAYDGTPRWSLEQSSPALTMRGSASPVFVGTSVIVPDRIERDVVPPPPCA